MKKEKRCNNLGLLLAFIFIAGTLLGITVTIVARQDEIKVGECFIKNDGSYVIKVTEINEALVNVDEVDTKNLDEVDTKNLYTDSERTFHLERDYKRQDDNCSLYNHLVDLNSIFVKIFTRIKKLENNKK